MAHYVVPRFERSVERASTLCRDAMDGWIASIARELPWSDEAVRWSFAEMVVSSLEGAFILRACFKTPSAGL